MVVERGDIWWADLPEPKDSMPGYRHPLLIVQSDQFNQSSLDTVIGIVITSNMRLSHMPGNIVLTPKQSGLVHDSVVNITQVVTANRSDLLEFVRVVPVGKLEQVERGLRLVLAL